MKTSDALQIIDHYVFPDPDPERDARMDTYRAHQAIAQLIYDLRTSAGLSQRELAERIGSKQSVISRLEDADYRGHSLSMLFRIARALGKELRLQIVDAPTVSPSAESTAHAA